MVAAHGRRCVNDCGRGAVGCSCSDDEKLTSSEQMPTIAVGASGQIVLSICTSRRRNANLADANA